MFSLLVFAYNTKIKIAPTVDKDLSNVSHSVRPDGIYFVFPVSRG